MNLDPEFGFTGTYLKVENNKMVNLRQEIDDNAQQVPDQSNITTISGMTYSLGQNYRV